jgi:hypothetical protein
MKISKDKMILAVFFVLFLILNAYLVVIHEPWRDEIHAWLITREMTIPEMVVFSRYEAHPILWNLLLFPFAKLGASPYSMYVISYLLVAVSAWLFLFKTEINEIAKVLILFSVPFVYIFSSIARDYCLILFLGMIICVMYKSRYEHPVIYSLVVSLLVFSHAMAWGFVAGVTITFNIYEIILKLMGKSKLSKKQFRGIVIGFVMIALSSIFAIVTLFGERSKVLSVVPDRHSDIVIISLLVLIVFSIVILIYCKGSIWKECVTLSSTYLFMILVYKTVYSSVIFQRLMLIPMFLLFFMIMALSDHVEIKTRIRSYFYILFILSLLLNLCVIEFASAVINDIRYNYSSAQEMADYINENLPDEDVILVDVGIYAQTIVPFTNKTLYDIRYKANIVDSLYHVYEEDEVVASIVDIPNHEEYKGKYLIALHKLKDTEVIYATSDSIMSESYYLYYIPE